MIDWTCKNCETIWAEGQRFCRFCDDPNAKIRELEAKLADTPDDLRSLGWSVAVHNDYRQNGVQMTFWLLTHPTGRWLKGEGATDREALDQIRDAREEEG